MTRKASLALTTFAIALAWHVGPFGLHDGAIPAAHAQPAQPQGGAVALPQGAIRLQPAQVIDPNGFERPMVAATVLVPAGWRTEGGVVWKPQDRCNGGYQVDFRATSPDGRVTAHILPLQNVQWNSMGAGNDMGCPSVRVENIQQYLMAYVQSARPGAQVLDYRPRPDISNPLRQYNSTTPMPMGESRAWVEAGEVLLGYQMNGVDMRESIAAAAIFTQTRMAMAGMAPTEFRGASLLPGFSMRAPNGQLDFRLAEMIRSSGKTNPEWQARINNMHAQNSRVALNETAKRSAIIAQTADDIRQIQSDTFQNTNAIQDRMSRENSEAIRGVETYNDPLSTTGQVELSNHYQNAWRLNDGSYVLTDDPSFNPYVVLGQDGTRLEVTQ